VSEIKDIRYKGAAVLVRTKIHLKSGFSLVYVFYLVFV